MCIICSVYCNKVYNYCTYCNTVYSLQFLLHYNLQHTVLTSERCTIYSVYCTNVCIHSAYCTKVYRLQCLMHHSAQSSMHQSVRPTVCTVTHCTFYSVYITIVYNVQCFLQHSVLYTVFTARLTFFTTSLACLAPLFISKIPLTLDFTLYNTAIYTLQQSTYNV